MDLYNLWARLNYEQKRKFKFFFIILIILISYVFFPLFHFLSFGLVFSQHVKINDIIYLSLMILFALILITNVTILYFIKPYSNKKLPLALISHVVSFLTFILLWRIIIIQISNLSIVINDFIFIILYLPITIAIIIRSIGKILVEKIDFKIKAIILKEMDNHLKRTPIWKIKNKIINNELILLDSEYKQPILEKLPKILTRLREENLVNGSKIFHLTPKGRDLKSFYFGTDSIKTYGDDKLTQEKTKLNQPTDKKNSKMLKISEQSFRVKKITCKHCGAELPPESEFCRNCRRGREIFHPEFIIDDNGVALCKTHTQFQSLRNSLTFLERICNTCIHAKNDDCYFPRAALRAISRDMGFFHGIFNPFHRSKFRCDICGRKIHIMSNILYKFYMEEFKNIEIVQLCCSCNRALKKGKTSNFIFQIGQPLLILINLVMLVLIFNSMANYPFNLLIFLILMLIPLIPGTIWIGIRLKRRFARKDYIKKLKG